MFFSRWKTRRWLDANKSLFSIFQDPLSPFRSWTTAGLCTSAAAPGSFYAPRPGPRFLAACPSKLQPTGVGSTYRTVPIGQLIVGHEIFTRKNNNSNSNHEKYWLASSAPYWNKKTLVITCGLVCGTQAEAARPQDHRNPTQPPTPFPHRQPAPRLSHHHGLKRGSCKTPAEHRRHRATPAKKIFQESVCLP